MDAFASQRRPLETADLARRCERAREDQEERWRAGDRRRCEQYFAADPAIADDFDSAVYLIYSEYLLREELGEAPTAKEYLARFPQYRPQLDRLFELNASINGLASPDDLLESADLDSAATPMEADFELFEELGRGAMAVVYRARQRSIDRLVALKMLADRFFDEQDTRFRDESLAVGRLSHPNIVHVYAAGELRGRPFLALELVTGPTLAAEIKRRTFTPNEAAQLIATLASAIDYAHRHGIVHRDLKPANILFAGDGTPKIADFGLAKLLDKQATHTHAGAVLGTPAYMAPEQALGRVAQIGPAADIHALGALLHELLTGTPPFQADSSWATLQSVISNDPHLLSAAKHVPADLQAICLRCLEKAPEQRYPSALALAEDLARFLEGRPTYARPLPAGRRAVRWARRHPWQVALLLVTSLSLAAITTGGWIYSARLQTQLTENQLLRDAAEKRAQLAQRQRRAGQLREVQKAYDSGEFLHAANLLARIERDPTPHSPADFVWRYWQRALNAPQHTLRGHRDVVYAAEYSPNGRTLASIDVTGTLMLWDADQGTPLGAIDCQAGNLNAVAFLPDGGRGLCGGQDGTLRIWQAAPLRELAQWQAHAAEVRSVAVSGDKKLIASGDAAGEVRLWDLESQACLATFRGHTGWVWALAFAGDQLLSGAEDGTIRAWDLNSLSEAPPFPGHTDWVVSLAVSPNGQLLASGGKDRTVRLWERSTGRNVAVFRGGDDWMRSVAFAPDGRTLISADTGGVVRLWDVETQQLIRRLPVTHGRELRDLALSPDGRSFATAGANGTLKTWVFADLEPIQTVRGNWSRQLGYNWLSCSGDRLLVVNNDCLQLRRQADLSVVVSVRSEPAGWRAGEFLPSGRAIGIIRGESYDGAFQIELRDPHDLSLLSRADAPDALTALALHPSGQAALAADASRALHSIKLPTLRSEYASRSQGGQITRMALAAEGALTILSSGSADTFEIWQTAPWKQRLSARSTGAFAVSADQTLLAFGSVEPAVRLVKLPELTESQPLVGHTRQVAECAFAQQGFLLATVDIEGTLILWDTEIGENLLTVQTGKKFHDLTFTPDGTALIAAVGTPGDGRDWALWVWRAPGDLPRSDAVAGEG
jgi:WD40 repeat protein